MPISITAVGRVGNDAEIKFSDSGTATARFSIASNRRKGKENETDWLDCVVFGKRAEFAAEWVKKGKLVYVRGQFETRKHDGKTYFSCVVDDLDPFLEKKGEGAAAGASSGGSDFGF